MAKIIHEYVVNDSRLLEMLDINLHNFAKTMLCEIPVKATGLLAKTKEHIEWDKYGNPYIVKDNARISLAAAIIHKDKVFCFDRKDKAFENESNKIDVIGSVGFGLPSLMHKIPVKMFQKKILNTNWSPYVAIEETDGYGDKKMIKMPILVIELEETDGIEQFFSELPKTSEKNTAKLNAAIEAIQHYWKVFGKAE